MAMSKENDDEVLISRDDVIEAITGNERYLYNKDGIKYKAVYVNRDGFVVYINEFGDRIYFKLKDFL